MKASITTITTKNIFGYIQGNFRKFVEDIPSAIPKHIYEQIQYRIGVMNITCLENKQCPCACSVPQKQYEDRSCELNCYGPILKKAEWETFKKENSITKESITANLYNRRNLL